LENIKEIDKFLNAYDQPKLSQEDITYLNRSIENNEIEVTVSLPKKKSPEPDRFTAEFYQTFKELTPPTLLKLFHEIERERTLPYSFADISITFIAKPEKDKTKK
jgi:hypothetical protein